MPALMIPENYKYTVLGAVVVPFVANMVIGGPVMGARKLMNVPYPNLYATPGVHEKADAFNRIQRGHQNMFETVNHMTFMSLVGGLSYPLLAGGCGVLYSLGSYFYMKGYADMAKDVAMARYTGLAPIKIVGLLGSFALCCKACYDMP